MVGLGFSIYAAPCLEFWSQISELYWRCVGGVRDLVQAIINMRKIELLRLRAEESRNYVNIRSEELQGVSRSLYTRRNIG